jgi:hypothetical protein
MVNTKERNTPPVRTHHLLGIFVATRSQSRVRVGVTIPSVVDFSEVMLAVHLDEKMVSGSTLAPTQGNVIVAQLSINSMTVLRLDGETRTGELGFNAGF